MHWIALLVINGGLVVGLFWLEGLKIRPVEHTLLSIALIVVFWLLLNEWITNHEIGLLVDKLTKDPIPLHENQYRFVKSADTEHDHA
jgi:hypothetical protein